MCEALGDLYCAAGGSGWLNRSGWEAAANGTGNVSYCQFANVRCWPDETAQALSMSAFQLSGSIPATLGNLNSLMQLDLSANSLSGSIPASLASLTRLLTLKLNANALSGCLPAALGSAVSLTELWLNDNRLSGSIPAQLGSLSALGMLALTGNLFTGALPAFLLAYPFSPGNVSLPVSVLGASLTVCPAGSSSSRVSTFNDSSSGWPSGSNYFPAPTCVAGCPPGQAAPYDGAACTLCPNGTHANTDSTACEICPPGAVCLAGLALPAAGFWLHNSSSTYMQCEDGLCLAGTPAAAASASRRRLLDSSCDAPLDANCRCGHQGTLCGSCAPGWARQGQFCERCPTDSALATNAHGKLGGVVFISVVLFLSTTLLFILSPIFKPEKVLAGIMGCAL